MKKVYIKYNPYKVETEIKIDGIEPKENSKLREHEGKRLQNWIEELPKILVEEYNVRDFDIEFYGTQLDYDDLIEILTTAQDKGVLTFQSIRKPAKEVKDKEGLIDEVFEEILKGPFEELKSPEIKNAFLLAKSEKIEISVVATMSAGKSTLINSLLREKLMPSKQEACTAIITRIEDKDQKKQWTADIYDKEETMIERHEKLTYEKMKQLNDDENVSQINIQGNIPFVSTEDMSLVLIDTPGPNNARNDNHREVQESFLKKHSKTLVIYIMEATYGSDDDNSLLERVASSMSEGGKQSKDRFIFVVNKLDNLNPKEGDDPKELLESVRQYLEEKGIKDPNIFPATALPALNIRLIEKDVDIDEDSRDETEMRVRKLIRNESLHFEKYAKLPLSIKKGINERLIKAKDEENKNEQALIHTGVISIEAAIKQYVEKYAKTAKIKNIVDIFSKNLKQAKELPELKKKLSEDEAAMAEIVKQLENIENKRNDLSSVREFEKDVDAAVLNVSDKSKNIVENIIKEFDIKVLNKTDSLRNKEILRNHAEDEISKLEKFAINLESEFKIKLDQLLRDDLIDTSEALLDKYKLKLKSLTEEFDGVGQNVINIDPLELIAGSIGITENFIIEEFVNSRKVADGEEAIPNNDKKWYKPWTWTQDKYTYLTIYKEVEYIEGFDLAQNFLAPIQAEFLKKGKEAEDYINDQCNQIKNTFLKEFKHLDKILDDKLKELKDFTTEKNKVKIRVEQVEEKLEWLDEIQNQMNSVLDI